MESAWLLLLLVNELVKENLFRIGLDVSLTQAMHGQLHTSYVLKGSFVSSDQHQASSIGFAAGNLLTQQATRDQEWVNSIPKMLC